MKRNSCAFCGTPVGLYTQGVDQVLLGATSGYGQPSRPRKPGGHLNGYQTLSQPRSFSYILLYSLDMIVLC